ncbi:hypothetical protein UACE39S_05091 [Ureibacillus acetophenoni]
MWRLTRRHLLFIYKEYGAIEDDTYQSTFIQAIYGCKGMDTSVELNENETLMCSVSTFNDKHHHDIVMEKVDSDHRIEELFNEMIKVIDIRMVAGGKLKRYKLKSILTDAFLYDQIWMVTKSGGVNWLITDLIWLILEQNWLITSRSWLISQSERVNWLITDLIWLNISKKMADNQPKLADNSVRESDSAENRSNLADNRTDLADNGPKVADNSVRESDLADN